MAHEHNVKDSDTKYSINPITRDIKNESSSKTRLMQYDHNSERITFSLPLRVEEHEMSKCNVVQINYINICSTTKEEYRGLYDVTDLKIEGEEVTFSWLVSGNATRYAGSLNFIVTLKCVTDGVVEYRWSSAIYSGITIANGIDNTNEIAYEYADVLERWRDELVAGGAVDLGDYYTKEEINEQFSQLKEDIANYLYVGDTAPTNGGLYWLDTSEDSGDSGEGSGGTETPTTTYNITNTLTNTTSSNSLTSITSGSSYKATFTANEGYELYSVKVTMGGVDISNSVYANGTVTIASVTGDIEITATSSAIEVSEVNLLETAIAVYENTHHNYYEGQRLVEDTSTQKYTSYIVPIEVGTYRLTAHNLDQYVNPYVGGGIQISKLANLERDETLTSNNAQNVWGVNTGDYATLKLGSYVNVGTVQFVSTGSMMTEKQDDGKYKVYVDITYDTAGWVIVTHATNNTTDWSFVKVV